MKAVRIYLSALSLAVLLVAAIVFANRGKGESSPAASEAGEASVVPRKTAVRDQPREAPGLIGMTLTSAGGAEAWASKLSRNEHEHAQRLADLKHLKKAEVIEFQAIAENTDRLSTDQLPLTLSLPSFDGGTMEVEFDHLTIDGPAGGTMAGKIVGQPDTSVVLGFHNGETSGIIEGPGKMIFLDAFDQEVTILRELDAEAHAKDFQCDCMLHRAQREQAAPEPLESSD
jgi:hypothetical protein